MSREDERLPMPYVETATCSECGRSITAPLNSSKWKKWRVILEDRKKYPPIGYLCPTCYKSKG